MISVLLGFGSAAHSLNSLRQLQNGSSGGSNWNALFYVLIILLAGTYPIWIKWIRTIRNRNN